MHQAFKILYCAIPCAFKGARTLSYIVWLVKASLGSRAQLVLGSSVLGTHVGIGAAALSSVHLTAHQLHNFTLDFSCALSPSAAPTLVAEIDLPVVSSPRVSLAEV